MRIQPTVAAQVIEDVPAGGTQQTGMYYDVSLESPAQQTQVLVSMLEADDAMNPSPDTQTPPWGEPVDPSEFTSDTVLEESYMPTPDMQAAADYDPFDTLSEAPSSDIPEWTWENDPQYHGLGVPPGVPNYNQPVESGHTQITVPNPSAENGWDEWSGRPKIARVARQENMFRGYNAGTSRGHMIDVANLQNRNSATYENNLLWQRRNGLMIELQRRGLHNAVVSDVPAPTFTEEVVPIDPTSYMQGEIGPEGVLP